LLDYGLLEKIPNYSDADFCIKLWSYYLSIWRNNAIGVIKNNNAKDNEDKKIVIIQNSIGGYSDSFLACDMGEIDLLYHKTFTGSIREYINQTHLDMSLS
jgi:hypothetical protein